MNELLFLRKTMSFLLGILTEYRIDVILFPDRGDGMVSSKIVFLAVYILVCLDCFRYRKKLEKREKDFQRLENELKYLQQENYYLKRMNNID